MTVKADVVDLLTSMGLHLKRQGDTRRARAYMTAANAIARKPDAEFEVLVAEGRLKELRGIGESIERTIAAFVEHGERPSWLPERVAADEEDGTFAGFETVPQAYLDAPFPHAPDLHCHTTWSDGTLSLEEVVLVAEKLGAKAIGISDHSGSLHIARGLQPDEVRAQWEEIDRVQKAHPDILILKGTECDILRDGRLDHPEEILEGFDYVIGSLHSALKLPEKEQTERVLTALENPHLTVLGHPTTQIPGTRPRANLDLARVFEKAAEHDVAMEVNGNPGRLDLDIALARKALAAGCKLSVASDGHSAHEMLSLAVARLMAAEAGATEDDLFNYDLL